MRRLLVLSAALGAMTSSNASPAPESCSFAQARTVNGRVPVYMGTLERTYRICTSGSPTSSAKRLEIFADGTATAALPTHKGGGKPLCVDVGGKRIEVGFDADDYPFAYAAVNALSP